MTGTSNASMFAFAEGDLADAPTSHIERDLKIFRAGSFIDSTGRSYEATVDDLDKAVEHFNLLRAHNVLPNIPVRVDHTKSLRDVIGYMTAVRREGEFLVGDFEWVDGETQGQWSTKLRNRSIEIGRYVDNDGNAYEPVVLGLAFVDLPAVEGLFRIAENGENMGTENDTTDTTDQADDKVEDTTDEATDTTDETTDTTDDSADDKADDKELVGAGTFQAGGAQPHTFRIGGAETQDFGKVQAHIDSLETFRKETLDATRTGFVDQLVTDKIIGAPQGEKFRALVVDMTADQFGVFKEGFEGMAPANLFAKHDLGEGGDPQDTDATADRIAVLEGVVQQARFRGTSEDDIKNLSSYQELQTLKSNT